MFKSLRTSLGLTFGFLILIGLLSTGTTLWTVKSQSADALVINLAGRERMLSQRVAKLALAGMQHRQDASYLAQMHSAAHEWEEIFKALRDGGEVVYEGRIVALPPTTDPLIRAQLERVWSLWQPFHLAAQAVVENPPGSPAFVQGLADVDALSESILTEMERAVQLYQAAASSRVAQVERIQLAFLITGALVVALGFGLIARQIIRPLERLASAAGRMAAGDLSTPVPLVAKNEIGDVAAAFEEMCQHLAASRAELERWTAELENRVAARTREIATLSAIVQAVNHHTEIKPLLAETLPLLCETVGASTAWVSLLDERGSFHLAGAHNLPPALEADDRAEMRWLGCTCQRKLLAGELTAAANILECQRLQQARGDTRGLRYHASVPLRVRDRTLGLLNLTTASGRVFSDDELRLLSAVGDQIGVAIERARLHEQVKAQRIEEQAALLKLSQALLSETDAQTIINHAVRAAAESLRVEFAAIALIDADGQTFSGRAGIGWPPEILQQAQRIPLTASTGLAYAIRTQSPVVIPDESRETRLGTPPWVTQMGIVSSLLVPMVVAGQAIGGIVVNSRTARVWSEDEVRLLSLIANDTALALERAQQYSAALERLERITALHDINVAMTANLNLEQRLNILLEQVTERLRVDAAALALIEPETHNLVYAARRGLDSEFFSDDVLKVHESVVARVVHSGEVAAIVDVRTEPRFVRRPIAERLGIVSYLAVPLRGRMGIIGVLELASRQPHVFAQEEIDFFVTLAGQAAIAIENAQLFEETQRRALEQSVVSEIARALNAALDVRQAFPTIVQGLRALTQCDRVSLVLLDETPEYFTLTVLDEPRPELAQGTRLPITATSAAADILAGRPHLTADLSAEVDYPAERALYQAGHRARVNLPLIVGERVIGALNLTNRQPGAFTAAQLPVLQQIASAVAIAIENTRLFEAERTRREELAALYDLSRALADVAYDFDAILHLIARHAVETVRVTFARIAVVEGEEFVVRAAHPIRLMDRDLEVGRREPTAAHPFCQRALEQNTPIVLHADSPEINDYERETLFLGLAQTLCLVPLRASERALGLLMLGEMQRDAHAPFTPDKIRLARSVGDQAASALRRAELYAELERAYLQTVLALANAVDAKDTYTADHAQRLAQMALAVGRELGMNARELEDLRYGAILHDIGKIGVPDAVLRKPAKLDAAEWEEMRQHPIIGAWILAPVPRLAGAARIVRHHHERYDGKGYPDGLAGEAIPLGARILTVVDSYSAIVDQRVYKAARSHAEAVAELKRHAGTQFDPHIVQVFLRLLERGTD